MNPNPSQHAAPLGVRGLLQARILARLFARNVENHLKLVLKGGLAMRAAHGSERQTKDIDLDAESGVSMGSLQKRVRSAIHDATRGGWIEQVVVSEPKQTPTTARWKIAGTLPDTGEIMHLTVEVSLRRHISDTDVRQVTWTPPSLPSMTIPVYRDEVLAIGKIDALLSPHRTALRDVVDLFVLFEAGVEIPVRDLADRLSAMPPPAEGWVQAMWDKVESMDDARFQTEVLPVWSPPPFRATKRNAAASDRVPWPDWAALRLEVATRLEPILGEVERLRRSGPPTHRGIP